MHRNFLIHRLRPLYIEVLSDRLDTASAKEEFLIARHLPSFGNLRLSLHVRFDLPRSPLRVLIEKIDNTECSRGKCFYKFDFVTVIG